MFFVLSFFFFFSGGGGVEMKYNNITTIQTILLATLITPFDLIEACLSLEIPGFSLFWCLMCLCFVVFIFSSLFSLGTNCQESKLVTQLRR